MTKSTSKTYEEYRERLSKQGSEHYHEFVKNTTLERRVRPSGEDADKFKQSYKCYKERI